MSNTRRSILETIDTDRFLDMPVTAQLLYFHLAIRADSNGYILSPNATNATREEAIQAAKREGARLYLVRYRNGQQQGKKKRISLT